MKRESLERKAKKKKHVSVVSSVISLESSSESDGAKIARLQQKIDDLVLKQSQSPTSSRHVRNKTNKPVHNSSRKQRQKVASPKERTRRKREEVKAERRSRRLRHSSSSGDRIPRRDKRRESSSDTDRSRSRRARSPSREKENFTVRDLKDAWRREFKIKGQIGKPGEKDNKLDFLALQRAIEAGLLKGYSDSEIIEAVIQQSTGAPELRSVLISSIDMTVHGPDGLMDILESYFLESESDDLVQQLSTAKQSAKDDPQTFLLKVVHLKNRIVREGEADGGGFSEDYLRKIMLKTLRSGISDERILNDLRPILKDTTVSDGRLLKEMKKAVRADVERKEKHGKAGARVNKLEGEEGSDKSTKTKDAKRIAKLEAELDEVKQHQGRLYRQYGCENCKLAGTSTTCEHCFFCGKGEHRYSDCPARKDALKKKACGNSCSQIDCECGASNSNRSPVRD